MFRIGRIGFSFNSTSTLDLTVPFLIAIRNKTSYVGDNGDSASSSFPHKTLYSVTMRIYSIHTKPARLDLNLAYKTRGGYIAIRVLVPKSKKLVTHELEPWEAMHVPVACGLSGVTASSN